MVFPTLHGDFASHSKAGESVCNVDRYQDGADRVKAQICINADFMKMATSSLLHSLIHSDLLGTCEIKLENYMTTRW